MKISQEFWDIFDVSQWHGNLRLPFFLFFFLNFNSIVFVFMGVFAYCVSELCVSAMYVNWHLQSPEEGMGASGTGVTNGCEALCGF